jgi:hypothetical protein
MTTEADTVKAKKSAGRRIFSGCILLCVLLFVACLGIGYYIASVKKAETGWNHLPADATFAFEAYEVHELVTALHKDGMIDVLLSIMQNKDGDIVDVLADNELVLPPMGDTLAGYVHDYIGAGSFLRSIVTPKSVLLGINSEYGEDTLFALFQTPSWVDFCYWFLPYADGTIHPFGKEPERQVYATRYKGWVVCSESYALVEKIVESWDKSPHQFGPPPATDKPNVKFAVLKQTSPSPQSASQEEPVQDNPFLSGMATFNLDIKSQERNSSCLEEGRLNVLIELDAEEWLVRKSWVPSDAPDTDKAEFAYADRLFPPEQSADASGVGHVMNFSFSLPRQNYDFRDMIDEAVTAPNSRRDNATKNLAWIWARWGWLENSSGEFVLFADAVDFNHEFATPEPVMPLITLGWITRGDHAKAVREFEDSMNMFLASALAPGGNVILQGIKNSISMERISNPVGSGAAIDLPPALTYWTSPAWLLSTPRAEGPGLGFITTNQVHLPGNEAMYLFNWPGFSFLKPTVWTDQYAFAGKWHMNEVFRDNVSRIVDEIAPTVGYFAPDAEMWLRLANLGVKKILPLYPSGSTTGFFNPATGVAAAKTRITRN